VAGVDGGWRASLSWTEEGEKGWGEKLKALRHDLLHEFARRYNRALPRLIFPLRLPEFFLQHVTPLLNQALSGSVGDRERVSGKEIALR